MDSDPPGPAESATIGADYKRLESENAALRRQLDESAARELAIGDVLRAISRAADLDPILTTIVEHGTRLCRATSGWIYRYNGEFLQLTADFAAPPAIREITDQDHVSLESDTIAGRTGRTRRVVHIRDIHDEPGHPWAALPPLEGYHTGLGVPLLREDALLGAMVMLRAEIDEFSEREIQLLETFADQAVIAIENGRLISELRDRNLALTESLAQQTTTAEILRVIASSPTDLQDVLDAIAENAVRLCEADDAGVAQLDGDRLRQVAHHGLVERRSFGGLSVTQGSPAGRAVLERRTIHVHDAALAAESEFPDLKEVLRHSGVRTVVVTPLLREGEPIGTIIVRRDRVVPFTDRQIALLETFADQAVIAIENARLFDELAELNRTLEARVSDQVDELERVGRLRRYLSPQLAELIVSSGDESILDSHRRQITVVFCDLRGFTAFAETAEPEEVSGVLAEYHTAMGSFIREHGGTLDKFAGDGIMVFFNDPVPQPDHAVRAVRMACAMRERAGELARGWRRAGYELDFGVGIAVGYATLGRVGFEDRYDYTAIGSVANLASRLCDEAGGRQILVSGRLLGMVENLVEAESLGDLELKGFHRPVAAWNIVGLRIDELSDKAPMHSP